MECRQKAGDTRVGNCKIDTWADACNDPLPVGGFPGFRPKLIWTGPRNWCRSERKATAVTGADKGRPRLLKRGVWPVAVLSDLSVNETQRLGGSVRRPR